MNVGLSRDMHESLTGALKEHRGQQEDYSLPEPWGLRPGGLRC